MQKAVNEQTEPAPDGDFLDAVVDALGDARQTVKELTAQIEDALSWAKQKRDESKGK